MELCSPHQQAAAAVSARRRRLAAVVLTGIAGVAAVVALVVSDSRPQLSSALLEYYQPWQARSTPAVDEQELVGGYAAQRVQDAERGVMRALYRSANGGDDAGPTPEPAIAGAPSYASELNFLKQDLPSRRAEKAQQKDFAVPSPWRQEEELREEEAVRHQAQLKQEHVVAAKPGAKPVGVDTLKSTSAIKDAKQLEAHAPAGYHLAWVANDPTPKLASPVVARSEMARENGGRDELPFFPMTPIDVDQRPDAHVEWVAPGPCMLRDGTDMGYPDRECQHHEVVDDQYPSRPLISSTFPSDNYQPDIQYPYIKGPYYHHLVDANDNAYQGYQRGTWVWKPLGKARRPAPPPRGSYAEWFANFRNPDKGHYGQDGR